MGGALPAVNHAPRRHGNANAGCDWLGCRRRESVSQATVRGETVIDAETQ